MTDTKIRLADLEPSAVGRNAAQRVLNRLTSLSIRLSPGITLDVYAPRPRDGQIPARGAPEDRDLDSTDLAITVATLTEYAQKGLPAWDWTNHGMAADAINDVVEILATDALGTEGGLEEVLLDHQGDGSDDPVRLTITAAWARVQLSQRQAVTAAQLGALAGLHPSRVRALRGAGEIPGWEGEGTGRGSAPCSAKAAKRWLEARGVKGL